MKRNLVFATASLLMAGSIVPMADAEETGAFACPAVGTVLQMTQGGPIRALGGSGLDCNYRISGNQDFTQHGVISFSKVSKGQPSNPAFLALANQLWPLAVGKTVSANISYNGQPYVNTYRVIGFGDVTVAAGTFPAWQIEETQTTLGTGNTLGHQRWWSPTVGYTVKYTTELISGRWEFSNNGNWELYTLKRP